MNLMRKKQTTILLIFLTISFLIFFFKDTSLISSITSFFQNSISNTRAAIFSSTVNEETKLQEENRKLFEKLAELEILERENIALRSQFEESNSAQYMLIPAKIVGYKGRGVYNFFIINAGINQGIENGMAVVVGNTLIGTIHKTSQNISEVRTILHPEFSTIVKYPTTNARGIIRGFNSYMIMENVLITDTLEKDGIVVTMGEVNNTNIGIPSDLIVGKIGSIERIETASFQTAQVEPMVDYSQISNVFVISGI
jgi:rod shape-determining protein MreC